MMVGREGEQRTSAQFQMYSVVVVVVVSNERVTRGPVLTNRLEVKKE